MKVAIVDYGMGNLGSVRRAFAELGAQPMIVDHPAQLDAADRIVLPGVGSFADGMAQLDAGGWTDALRNQVAGGKPLLGICLGMQLLASRGSEGGCSLGLGLIAGEAVRLDRLGCTSRIPHVGWNSIHATNEASRLLVGIPEGTDFYFVHSFAFCAEDQGDVIANTEYGIPIPAIVGRGSVFGTQFHPEKSSRAGFRLLKNFLVVPPC